MLILTHSDAREHDRKLRANGGHLVPVLLAALEDGLCGWIERPLPKRLPLSLDVFMTRDRHQGGAFDAYRRPA